ncbi:helix-turn-helix transcriptional regulator [Citricoccus muralis]|uniref:Helix-turn-helix transcriptional regulator n=1 Tax=Citricoccus muralis TaxID=169134 RepID=A0ABY8H504_9MICC|nr:helix-turn-helix transcriptional regulator [Citricoccus muralis]WFP15732.1 helix-turn-helix transcriptional regulator [Citricoccus muralis]
MTTARTAQHSVDLSPLVSLAREQHSTLTVTDLADHLGYSPFHFARLFRQRTGITPGQFLTALRLDAAKRLLLHDDDAVIDVAAAVGFDSLSSFSRRFRSVVGVAPGQLRRLAHTIADRPPRPFALCRPTAQSVHLDLELPEDFSPRGDAYLWIGWYPQPAPLGLPAAGVLVQSVRHLRLPLCPGAPFLLGFAVAAGADPLDQLTPEAPMVAAHPAPLTTSTVVRLVFSREPADPLGLPLLSALPSLCRR